MRRQRRANSRGHAAEACLLIALLTSMLSLSGWLINARWLSGFGVSTYPDWPLAAIANEMLALALFATVRDRDAPLMGMISIPMLIGFACLLEYISGVDLGFDALLFKEQVLAVPLPTPGRPGLLPTVSIMLVAMLALILPRRERWADQAILALAGTTIGIGAISITLLLLGAHLTDQGVRLTSSLPASIASIAMAVGALVW